MFEEISKNLGWASSTLAALSTGAAILFLVKYIGSFDQSLIWLISLSDIFRFSLVAIPAISLLFPFLMFAFRFYDESPGDAFDVKIKSFSIKMVYLFMFLSATIIVISLVLGKRDRWG